MKQKLLLILAVIITLSGNVYAGGGGGSQSCMDRKSKKHHTGAKTTLADAGEDNYDIKHLKFDLQVTDTSTYIKGNVTTTAQVTASSLSVYVFELSVAMNIDSAKINGVTILPGALTTVGSVRKITLASPLASGTIFTAQIFYRGTPPTGAGFFNGITHAVSSGGTHMLYTVSDPWVALNWWPCKQSVLDKIDSVDMYVTVPYGVVDGSEGLLLSVDNTSLPGYSKYHWQTHYPIAYYLISIAVAKYGEYKSYMHFTSSTDSMLIQNFLMDTTTFNPLHKAKFDSIGYVVDYFSNLYGVRYPFWKEKYGMCFTNLTGGMEHQTMTTIGVTNTQTMAHELTHQWFGDNVTYRTWGDMWLSEGFATFSEQLFYEHFWTPGHAKSHRQGQLSQMYTQPCGMVYVNDTTTSDSLFTVNQYPKAALIINNLRYMAPEDSLFFKIMRVYQNTYGLKNASTADFKAIAESIYGFNLDTFFNQWIYGRGYPMYKVSWNQSGSTVYVKLMQSQSCPSYTNHFSTPIQLQLKSATLDTFIKVYNSIDTQIFTFTWGQTMTGVGLNPDVWTPLKQIGSNAKDPVLGVGSMRRGHIKVHPNPAKNYWQVEELPEETNLTLTDMAGKVLWEGKSTAGTTTIPGERLPSGNYILTLAGIGEHVKLVHW
jgi:aminopeptidase N